MKEPDVTRIINVKAVAHLQLVKVGFPCRTNLCGDIKPEALDTDVMNTSEYTLV